MSSQLYRGSIPLRATIKICRRNSMANLYEETIYELQKHNKTMDDVIIICTNDYSISKENFKEAANFWYYDGYGTQEINEDLKFIGKDFVMVREEYDGSEWWRFIHLPMPDELPEKQVTEKDIRCY